MHILTTSYPTGSATAGKPPRRRVSPSRRIRGLTAILLAGALVSGCGPDADEGRARSALNADVEAICAVADEGRSQGRAPYDSAAAYAARSLEDAGVEAGVKSPEATPSFVQSVPLVRNLVGDETKMTLRIGRGMKRLLEGRRTFLLVAPGDSGRVMDLRPPVFVGHGLHAPEYGVDDFAGLDLSGRAVLVTATPPDAEMLSRLPGPVRDMYADPGEAQHRRMSDIIERGAAAIFLLPDRWLVDRWDALSASESRPAYRPTEPYPGHVLGSPIPIALLHADLVDRLFLGRAYHPISHVGRYGTFELDDISLRLDIDVRREPLTTANVVGIVRGADPALRDEYIVVGAQLDGGDRSDDPSLSPWDAAAVASVLQVARSVAGKPARRSVVFVVFVGEEGGLWGSLQLLAHPPVPRDAIVASIHVVTGEIPGRPDLPLRALASPPVLVDEVEDAAPHRHVEVLAASEERGWFRGTTGGAFVEEGIPSMLVTVGGCQWTASSCADDLDAGCLMEAAHLLHALVSKTANARGLEMKPRPEEGKDASR